MENLLTVNVVTYNHAEYIKECLDSLLSQETNFGYIIRIFDDCSTDGTTEICQQYEEKYPDKVFLFPNSVNENLHNCIRSYENIKTKYYMYIEGDDYCCDNSKFQKQIDILEAHPEYVFCAHNTKISGGNLGREISKRQGEYEPLDEGVLIEKNFISPHISSKIVRTECIKIDKDNPKPYLFDATQTMIQLMQGKAYHIGKTMTVYRVSLKGCFSSLDYLHKIKRFKSELLNFNEYTKGKYEPLVIKLIAAQTMFYIMSECKANKGHEKIFYNLRNVNSRKALKRYLFPLFVTDILNLPRDIIRLIKEYYISKQVKN